MKKVLLISSFPPTRCGVGTYAQEHLRHLKREGHTVYTLAFEKDSSAHFVFDSKSTLQLLKALYFLVRYDFDKVYLHFTNGLIWTRHKTLNGYLNKMLLMLWTTGLSLRHWRKTCLIGHEILTENLYNYSKIIQGFLYSLFGEIEVHTDKEKENCVKTFGNFLEKKIKVVKHERFFRAKYLGNSEEARASLKLPKNKIIFLSIGFWLKSKGFEDAIEAVSDLDPKNYELYIVGSLREQTTLALKYREKLRKLSSPHSHIHLIEEHTSEEDFDKWITAADALVLPYHMIWSSGVGARAQILKTPILSREHKHLKDQLQNSETLFFKNMEELKNLMKKTTRKKSQSPSQKTFPQKKTLIVIGAFGKKVHGGAESFVYKLTKELSKRGAQLEVWTTDSSNIVNRNHELKDEKDEELSFKVRRFPVNDKVERIFQIAHYLVQKFPFLSIFNRIWVQSNIYGYGMKEALLKEGQDFDSIHLFHYLHGTSHRLSGIFPSKTLLHPFIHKEGLLYHPMMKKLFAGVRGVTCNTKVSMELAVEASCGLPPSFFTPIGNGIEEYKGEASRKSLPSQPYIIFLGRMIPDKNLPLLLEWHESFVKKHKDAPGLLCVGKGPLSEHELFKENLKFQHKSWISEEEKHHILSHAQALVQLSLLESFSLVMMEAWMAGTPIVIHKECPAMMEHLKQAQGGAFAVDSYEEYEEALLKLKEEETRKSYGSIGQAYVKEHFTWDKVCKNYVQSVEGLLNH